MNLPAMTTESTSWVPDILGDGYECRTLPLGVDPDGEGHVVATLVRHSPQGVAEPPRQAVLYVHGYTDYFFQTHVAEFFAARGEAFYALDLRKCGRSRRNGQSPHFVTDLALYDTELTDALRIVRAETGLPVLLVAHSTGGLILSLWLDRLNSAPGAVRDAGVTGVVLNSPWFDLQGPAYYRTVLTPINDVLGRFLRRAPIPGMASDTYGTSLHITARGSWDYNLEWKPLHGFPVRFGWLRAIRRGHARLHRGLDIGVPALILRSKVSRFSRRHRPEVDLADAVLDVKQIQRWSGCLGDRTSIVPIEGARHDVFLSEEQPRATAFAEMAHWLDWLRTA